MGWLLACDYCGTAAPMDPPRGNEQPMDRYFCSRRCSVLASLREMSSDEARAIYELLRERFDPSS